MRSSQFHKVTYCMIQQNYGKEDQIGGGGKRLRGEATMKEPQGSFVK